jgi:hypothetical protein
MLQPWLAGHIIQLAGNFADDVTVISTCPAWEGLTSNETPACNCRLLPNITDTVLKLS